ncbi:MAG: isocitrate/isopropylmalate family dehydrogenase, partial [Sphaerochaetaceae bacterium]
MKLKIALVPGDGIGPDIVAEAMKVLGAVCDTYRHKMDLSFYLAGGVAIDTMGEPLPEST